MILIILIYYQNVNHHNINHHVLRMHLHACVCVCVCVCLCVVGVCCTKQADLDKLEGIVKSKI